MLSFIICLCLLVAAYFIYGKVLEKIGRVNSKAQVPSQKLYDGIDYIPLPKWKTFLIQLLNIAGIGPIFGAIMGACFGPVSFIWITAGGIFLGAMHDFFSGLIAVRNNGLSLPEIIGKYQGKTMQYIMRIVTVVMSVLVGVVFMRSPAGILNGMIPSVGYWWWIRIILIYYIVATILPIDKIIAKFYPVFGAALIFMALGLLYILFTKDYAIPELDLKNYSFSKAPLIPTLCITIACGAISGFHATQSPLMARCVNNETECRMVSFMVQ